VIKWLNSLSHLDKKRYLLGNIQAFNYRVYEEAVRHLEQLSLPKNRDLPKSTFGKHSYLISELGT